MLNIDSRFELGFGYAGLAYDRLKGTNPKFCMVWNRYSNRGIRQLPLHHDMAAMPSNLKESMTCEDRTSLIPRKNTELRQ